MADTNPSESPAADAPATPAATPAASPDEGAPAASPDGGAPAASPDGGAPAGGAPAGGDGAGATPAPVAIPVQLQAAATEGITKARVVIVTKTTAFRDMLNGGLNGVESSMTQINDKILKAKNMVSDKLDAALGWAEDKINDVGDMLTIAATGAITAAESGAQGMNDALTAQVKSLEKDLLSSVTKGVTQVADSVSEKIGDVATLGKSGAKTLVDGMKSAPARSTGSRRRGGVP